MRGNLLTTIFEALKEAAGGYFVVRDGDEEFVIVRKQEFDAAMGHETETQAQLPLPQREVRAQNFLSDLSEDINREIALYQAGQFEEAARLDPWAEEEAAEEEAGKRVRFEPLRGDLPPELQE